MLKKMKVMTKMLSTSNELHLTVTDLKQFAYCPRILYFTYCLPVPRVATRKMAFGKDEHIQLDRLEKRRKLKRYGLELGERIFHAHLFSHKLNVEGKLDLHIVQERECYPVEFKHSHAAQFNHKVQLACYAALLEENMKKPVRTGFLYLIPRNEVIAVPFSSELRLYTQETIQRIRTLVESSVMPRSTSKRRRCLECEYRRYCRDVEIKK